MVNYQNSKIYKIEPICEHEEGDIYIGSTTKEYLSQRMDKHRSAYMLWKNSKGSHIRSYDLFVKYGVENCEIYLIENYPCDTIDELRTREGHFIKTLKCVNKMIAGRSQKEYYKENKDEILQAVKQYYNNHKEKVLNYQKEYCVKNKEKVQLYKQEYRIKNEHEIKTRQNNKHKCICGGSYTTANKAVHFKNKKHQKYLSDNFDDPIDI